MTTAPIHPATHEEFLRIALADLAGRAPVLHPASYDEFLRILGADGRMVCTARVLGGADGRAVDRLAEGGDPRGA